MVKLSPVISVLAITAYGLRFGASWLLLQTVPAERFDLHGFGLFAPAATPGRTVVSVVLLLLMRIARLRRLAWIIVAPTRSPLLGTWQLERSVADATRDDSEAASLSPSIARLEAPGLEDRTWRAPYARDGLAGRHAAPP